MVNLFRLTTELFSAWVIRHSCSCLWIAQILESTNAWQWMQLKTWPVLLTDCVLTVSMFKAITALLCVLFINYMGTRIGRNLITDDFFILQLDQRSPSFGDQRMVKTEVTLYSSAMPCQFLSVLSAGGSMDPWWLILQCLLLALCL